MINLRSLTGKRPRMEVNLEMVRASRVRQDQQKCQVILKSSIMGKERV